MSEPSPINGVSSSMKPIAILSLILGFVAGLIVIFIQGVIFTVVSGSVFSAFIAILICPINYLYYGITSVFVYGQHIRGIKIGRYFSSDDSRSDKLAKFSFECWLLVPVLGVAYSVLITWYTLLTNDKNDAYINQTPNSEIVQHGIILTVSVLLVALLNVAIVVLMRRYYSGRTKPNRLTNIGERILFRSFVYGLVYGHLIFLLAVCFGLLFNSISHL